MTSECEPLDLVEGRPPRNLSGTTCRQHEARTVAGPKDLGRHQEHTLTQSLKGSALQLRRQAQPLEPIHQVVGQQKEIEVRVVGEEVTRGDTAQRVIPLELFDEQLDPGAIVVEPPEVQRRQR